MNIERNCAVQPQTFREWQAYQFQAEAYYAKMILSASKGSVQRAAVTKQGYEEVIGHIIERYNPGAGGTHTQPITKNIIRTLLKPPAKILDVGCGGGQLLTELYQLGYDVNGIDVTDNCVQRADARLEAVGCTHAVSHFDILEYCTDTRFDLIVLDNVVEHIPSDTALDVFAKCHDLLANNGYLLIITPHRFSGPHDISMYFLPLGSVARGFHLREYTFAELEELSKAAGFHSVLGFWIAPRLTQAFKFNLNPSRLGAWKARKLEALFARSPLSKVLTINRIMSRLMSALLYPAACVSVKAA